MGSVSSASIRERLASLDALVVSLGEEFDTHASDAIGGVEGAGQQAAAIDARLGRLATDRKVLERALARAETAERIAAEAETERQRQEELAAARGHVARLIEVGKRADAAVANLVAILDEIATAEAAVRGRLARAGAIPSGGAMYQTGGLVGLAIEHISCVTDGRSRYQSAPKAVADAAANAWGYLMEDAR